MVTPHPQPEPQAAAEWELTFVGLWDRCLLLTVGRCSLTPGVCSWTRTLAFSALK